VACAVLNDSASDPYRQESNRENKMVTYFNPDTVVGAWFLGFAVSVDVGTRTSGFWIFIVSTTAYNTNKSMKISYYLLH
jgi:hypothetical protein